WIAPASAIREFVVMFRMRFIFILISVPPSATPQGAVEWFEPTARIGAGYWLGFLKTLTMSSTVFASTITLGCDTTSPNQLVTVKSDMIDLPATVSSRLTSSKRVIKDRIVSVWLDIVTQDVRGTGIQIGRRPFPDHGIAANHAHVLRCWRPGDVHHTAVPQGY